MILKKYNLSTLNGRINELIDNKHRIYRIPNYCINDPLFEKKIAEIDETHQIKKMTVTLYDVYEVKKTNISVSDNIKIGEIKKRFAHHNDLDMSKYKIRLLFGGSDLKDDDYLYQYNFQEGYIIQVLKVSIV